MKTLELQPEQIIVPGEYELSNETALRVYFDLCSRGHSKVLSPVIVTSSDITGKAGRQKRLV